MIGLMLLGLLAGCAGEGAPRDSALAIMREVFEPYVHFADAMACSGARSPLSMTVPTRPEREPLIESHCPSPRMTLSGGRLFRYDAGPCVYEL